MGLPKRLTEMQKRFAEFIVFGGPDGPVSQSEAAELVGYSKKRCRQEGSELTNPKHSPLVVQYIGNLKEERLKKFEVTYDGHIAELGKIRQAALSKGAWSAAVNAEVARGKAAGLYIEQKIIRTGKLDDLSEEDLDKRIAEVLDQYSPIIDGDAEELKEKVKEKQKEIRLDSKQRKKTTETLN